MSFSAHLARLNLGTFAGHDGEPGIMTSASYAGTALNPDNYLVSPKMKLDGKITFYACAQDASYAAEHFGVAVSTVSGNNPADFTMVQEWDMTAAPSLAPVASFNAPAGSFRSPRRVQGNWYLYEVDLSSYAGAEGYVAIRHFNCTDWFRLNVDDITLETSQLFDAYDPSLEIVPEKVTLPDGAEVNPYYTVDGVLAVYTSSGWADYTKKVKNINVAFVGTDVYLQGLAYWESEAWVKGTLAEKKITVPSGQYVGDGAYLNGMDENGGFLDSYSFTIDSEAGTISSEDYIAESASPSENLLYSYWIAPVFSLTAPEDPRVTPPAGLVTEDWTIARYFFDGEDETAEEKVIQIGFDGNDVYLNGMSYFFDEDNWIKGILSEDGKSITFASGQYYGAYQDTYDLYFAVYDLTTNALAPVTVAYDAEAGTITWPEDALILENGVADDFSAYGYFSEIVATVKGTAPEPLAAPDIVTTEWLFKSMVLGSQENEETGEVESVLEDYELHVQVGVGTNEVFVKGLCEDLPDAWIKGTLDPKTNKVTFPTGQHFGTYLFWFWEFDYFFDGYGENGFEDVVMNYDAASKTLTMESPYYMLINASWLMLNPNLVMTNAQMQEIPDVAAVPAKPTITGGKFSGTSYPYVNINVPTTDEKGNPILTTKLSYQFFSDVNPETPLTLTTDEYLELYENMTEIPYTFTDDWDIYNYCFYLNMDFSSWKKIGIQSIYRGGGVEKKSAIFWYAMINGTPILMSEEPIAMDWGVGSFRLEAGDPNLANAKVGDILHVAVDVPTPGDLWSAQVVLNDGTWTQLEGGMPVGDGNTSDAAFVITGDILKYIQTNGMMIRGAGYTTDMVTLESYGYEPLGSEQSVWVGESTGPVTVNVAHFLNANDKAGIKAGDVIRVTATGDDTWAILQYSGNDTGWSWTLYENMPAIKTETGFDFVVTADNVKQLLTDGAIVNTGGYTITQVELIPGEPTDIVVAPESGDITVAINDVISTLKNEQSVKDITVNLKKGVEYTISDGILAPANVVIMGNGATIDASALTTPFIKMSETPNVEPILNAEDGSVIAYPIDGIFIDNVTIKGLAQQLIYANKVKYLMKSVIVNNSVIGIAGASKKTIFDFNGGGNTSVLSVYNSTLWADAATEWQNGGFYSSQSGQDVVSLGGESQVTSIMSSTLYNIAKGKTTSTRRKNSQKWMIYEVKNSVIVNCGKKGEFYAGLNGGNANGGVWDINNNTVRFDGEDVSETEASKAKLGDDVIAVGGDPGFANADNGDFTLDKSSEQRKYLIGDPRWFTEYYIPANVTAAIDVTVPANLGIMDGEAGPTDLYYFLEDCMKDSENPAYIKLTLEPYGEYYISRPLEVMTAIEIVGDAAKPASIYAYQLGANPFVQIKSDWVSVDAPNEKGYFGNIYNVAFKNFNIVGLKGQIFYANKQKYVIPYMTVENCQFRMEGAKKKTFFDFNGGGFVESLTISNSTLSADDATEWQNGGFFSTQSGTKKADCGAEQMKFVLTNNTFYNVAKGKTLSTLRENSQNWMTFEVLNNIVVNSGKEGQFVKGLNAGNNKSAPTWLVNYNAFQWTTDNVNFADISGKEVEGADQCGISGNIVGEIAFKYTVPEFEETIAAIQIGDYTLADCPQKEAKIGDPRWLRDGYTGIQTLNAEKLSEGTWYTLQGVRVDKPTKGVFIHNGKKVVIK